MSKQQLFLRGMAVDMPTSEIKIKVESNLFSDADKIKTAHSYNIALPRTANNDKIMANAFVPASVSQGISSHCYLDASLWVDDVPLFEGGQAVLTSVNDKGYNLTLLWGLVSIFDEIKREGLNLCDLPMSSHWNESTMANWIDSLPQYDDNPTYYPQYTSGMNSTEYSHLDDDSKALADKTPWILPSVSAWTILHKIEQVYGVTITPSTEANIRINLLAHPLTTRKVLAKDEELSFILLGASHITGSRQWITLSSNITQKSNDNIFADAVEYRVGTTGAGIIYAKKQLTAKSIRITGQCDRGFKIVLNMGGEEKSQLATYNSSTQMWIIDYTFYDITAEENTRFIDLVPIEQTSEFSWSLNETPVINVGINVKINDIDDAVVGDKWCYERNYPEMGCIAYINEILAHIGGCIVGSINKANAIHISTFDEVMTATPQILQMQGVSQISMSLNSQAQKNIYTHQVNEDDGGEYYAEGEIYTNDETLDLERTAFESKFKVPIKGIVRLWEIEKNAGENNKDTASWVAQGDYIASNQDGYIYNYNQDFTSVINDYYINYKKLVEVPKIVEVDVRLLVLDLLNFNLGKPVYIEQLGRLYLIESIESNGNNSYKLKLVQI